MERHPFKVTDAERRQAGQGSPQARGLTSEREPVSSFGFLRQPKRPHPGAFIICA
jgi:hypothetical protein